MLGINWAQELNLNFIAVLPALVVAVTMLVVMVADLYVKQKRGLVWVTLVGIVAAMGTTWVAATDEGIAAGMNSGAPLEVFGNMVIADGFSYFLQAVLLGIVALITLLSMDYVEKFLKGMYLEFYEVLLASTLGMIFMVSSRDLLMIYLGLELASISSYVLAGLLRRDAKSNEAALKYFLNGALASAVLLFGLSLLYGATGTTYLPEMAAGLGAKMAVGGWMPLIVSGMIFMAGGFAFKVAAVPMHLWAPDVYEGSPTPVTAFFSVGPKGAAFGAILRVFLVGLGASQFSERWTVVWAVLAVTSMFVGNLTALLQTNVKRMMAYSSVAQAGYILVGVVAAGGMDPAAGVSSVLFYILAYAVTNLGIFAVLTHMDQEGGWVNLSDFNGLSQRNPLYAAALVLFFVSLIGIPPTAGFTGKFLIFKASVGAGYVWLAILMAINSVISVGYYYAVVRAMYLEKTDLGRLSRSPGVAATVVLALVGVVAIFMVADPIFGLTNAAAAIIP